jgi:hypothetical protein
MSADFKYQIDGRVLFIEDLNLGNKSVTNDIENVLDKISKELNTSVSNFDIIYKDSTGTIDGVVTKNNQFVDFYSINEEDYYAAKLKIKHL